MRIGLVSSPVIPTPPQRYGGLERMVAWLGKALISLGHDVLLFGKDGSYLEGADVYTTNKGTEEALGELLQAHLDEIDVVHCNTHDKKPLQMCHPPHYVSTLHVQHRAWNENVVCISKAQRQYLGFPETIPIVYHGIDPSEYICSYEKDDYLLFMGALMPYKNPSAAIYLAKQLDIPLYLAGISWDMDYWDKLKLEFGDNITYIGDVGGYEKAQLLTRAKALIHPVCADYTYKNIPHHWLEAGAIVAIEALVSGTPVITTPNGVMPEYITNRKEGFLCNTFDELVDAYNNLDKINKGECVKRGLEFNHLDMAKEYVKLYEKVLNGDRW